jgi:PAS domain S-box-containing protein
LVFPEAPIVTKDTNKTKEQLISELDLLRRRVAELEESGVGQRQTEERLLESRLQYDTTLESMVDAIHVVDRDLRIILFNDRFKQWNKELGLGSEVIGRPLFDVFRFLPEKVRDEYRQVFETGEMVVTEEATTLAGRDYFTETRKVPVMEEGSIDKVITIVRDITEQKRAAEALQRSEEKYRNIFENAIEGIFQTTPDGRYLSVNPALARMYGYASPAEMIAAVTDLQAQQYVNPQDRTRLKALYERQGYVEKFETRIYTKTKDAVWISMNGWAVKDTEGKIVHYEGTAEDITERKRREEVLQREKETFFTMLQHNPFGVALIDKSGIYRYVNPEFTNITGYTLEEVPSGRDWLQKAWPDPHYRQMMIDAWQRDRLSGNKPTDLNFTILSKDGRTKQIESRTTWFDEYSITVLNDVTERAHAEEALKRSEATLRSIVSASPVGIGVIGADRVIVWANESMASMMGYTPGELQGLPARRLYPTDEEFARVREMVYGEGMRGSGQADTRGLCKDGQIRDVHVSAARIDPTDDSAGFVFLATDITERKSLEAQLRQAQKMEAIGTLAGGVAHDFNNILMALMGYANLLEMRMDENDPLKVYIDQILNCTAKAASLTQSLLAFGRKQVMELKPHNVDAIVNDVEKLLRRLLPEDIELTLTLDADMTIMADMTQIDQVLMNLATNARDAMPKGGRLRIETRGVEIDSEFMRVYRYGKPGPYALISVSDTGTGMDATTQEKIFEPFFTTKEVGKGTGLGLSIVYGIVKQHGGYITVYSESGLGTTFRIYLPVISVEACTAQPSPTDAKGGSETILVAEDNPETRSIAGEILRMSGYTVIEAVDGRDAVEKFVKHGDSIGLLILDVVMPVKNGKEAYDEIRALSPRMKALFMSGYTGDVLLSKALSREGVEYVQKPLSPKQLLRKVREMLGA